MARGRFWDQVTPELAVPSGMHRCRFPAMGTDVSVLLPELLAEAGFRLVRSLFEEWEQTLSRFRASSELSFVNAHAGRPVTVSPLFMQVLTAALDAARATGGVFDPTLLPHLVAAGYDRTFSELPADRPAISSQVGPGGAWRSILVNRTFNTVVLPPGAALDVGGIAKGMAVDTAVEQLISLGADEAAVEAGGDLRVHGLPPGRPDWPVAVQTRDGYETVSLYEGALATSNASLRAWKLGGENKHHLIDAQTGRPATSDLWSVSVVTPCCVQADVAAKTALLLGSSAGSAFLEAEGLAGLLVPQEGAVRHVGPWLPARTEAAS